MILLSTLCFLVAFTHTVIGSPGEGMLCLASDSTYITEYVIDNEQSINQFYECPDPKGDQSHTSCCADKSYGGDNQDHTTPYDFFKGDTQHKCCLPPTSEDSVLKVEHLKLYIRLEM